MGVRIDPHTIEQMQKRGTNQDEIKDVLSSGGESMAKHGRKKKSKVFPYDKVWYGRFYEQKKVEVIYVQHNEEITTVTVYVYYGRWT